MSVAIMRVGRNLFRHYKTDPSELFGNIGLGETTVFDYGYDYDAERGRERTSKINMETLREKFEKYIKETIKRISPENSSEVIVEEGIIPDVQEVYIFRVTIKNALTYKKRDDYTEEEVTLIMREPENQELIDAVTYAVNYLGEAPKEMMLESLEPVKESANHREAHHPSI